MTDSRADVLSGNKGIVNYAQRNRHESTTTNLQTRLPFTHAHKVIMTALEGVDSPWLDNLCFIMLSCPPSVTSTQLSTTIERRYHNSKMCIFKTMINPGCGHHSRLQIVPCPKEKTTGKCKTATMSDVEVEEIEHCYRLCIWCEVELREAVDSLFNKTGLPKK